MEINEFYEVDGTKNVVLAFNDKTVFLYNETKKKNIEVKLEDFNNQYKIISDNVEKHEDITLEMLFSYAEYFGIALSVTHDPENGFYWSIDITTELESMNLDDDSVESNETSLLVSTSISDDIYGTMDELIINAYKYLYNIHGTI